MQISYIICVLIDAGIAGTLTWNRILANGRWQIKIICHLVSTTNLSSENK